MAPLFVLLLAASAPSTAGLPEAGVRAYEEMDLDAARDAFAKAQRAAPARERPRLELWLGIIELERGNEGAARRWLRSALQASPGLAVPGSVSPKVRGLVDELRPAQKAPRQTRVASRARVAPAPAPPAPAPAQPVVAAPAPPAPLPEAPAETVASLTAPAPAPLQSASVVAAPAPAAAPVPAPAPTPVPEPTPALQHQAPPPSPMLLASAGAGALALGALGGGVVLGAFAAQASADAEHETRAVDATARYEWATATAWLANGMYALGVVSAAVGAGCATVALSGAAE